MIFVIFFFFNVEFNLIIKKCKKVIFDKTILKKLKKKADLPLNENKLFKNFILRVSDFFI